MSGDDKIRACSLCSKNVYNISNMTRSEAESILVETGASACVGYYRRKDGTIVTDDCPIGLRQIRSGWRYIRRILAAFLGLLVSSNLLEVKVAQAAEGFKTQLVGQNKSARFGYGPTIWRPENPKTLAEMERSNSIEAAVASSRWIVEAQFLEAERSEDREHPGLPTATYRVLKNIKGISSHETVKIRYSLSDRIEIEKLAIKNNSSTSFPKEGERFILFLTHADSENIWTTYNGTFGRMPSNRMNMTAVITALNSKFNYFQRHSSIDPVPHNPLPRGSGPDPYNFLDLDASYLKPQKPSNPNRDLEKE